MIVGPAASGAIRARTPVGGVEHIQAHLADLGRRTSSGAEHLDVSARVERGTDHVSRAVIEVHPDGKPQRCDGQGPHNSGHAAVMVDVQMRDRDRSQAADTQAP